MQTNRGLLFTYKEDSDGKSYLCLHEIKVEADMLTLPKGIVIHELPFSKEKDLDLTKDQDFIEGLKKYIARHGSEPFDFHVGMRLLSRLKTILNSKTPNWPY